MVSCSAPPRQLVIDVRTDLVPTVELDQVRVEVQTLDGQPLGSGLLITRASSDLIRGARVLDLDVPDSVREATLKRPSSSMATPS